MGQRWIFAAAAVFTLQNVFADSWLDVSACTSARSFAVSRDVFLRGGGRGSKKQQHERLACDMGNVRKGSGACLEGTFPRVCSIRGGLDDGAKEDDGEFDALEKLIFSNPQVEKFASKLLSDPEFHEAAEKLFKDPGSTNLVKEQAQLPLPNEASGEERQDHVQEGPGPSTLEQDERDATGGQAAAPGGEEAPPGGRGSAQEQSGAGKAEEDGGGGQGHGSDGQQVGDKGEGGGGDGAAEDKVEAALFDMMSRSSRLMSMRWTEEKDKEMMSDPVLAAMGSSGKMALIREDLDKNGPMAILKYAKDPEALKIFERMTALAMK